MTCLQVLLLKIGRRFVGGISITACLLSRGAGHNKDWSIVACSVLFGGLTAAIYEWAAKIFKYSILEYSVELGYKNKIKTYKWVNALAFHVRDI